MTAKTASFGAALGWPNSDVMEAWWAVLGGLSVNEFPAGTPDARHQMLNGLALTHGFTEADLDRLEEFWTTNGGVDVLTDLASMGADALRADYDKALRPEGADDAVEAGHDDLAWYGFLNEYGSGWSGDEDVWVNFRTWFENAAAERGLSDSAAGFIAYVESAADKIAAFAEYGIHIAARNSDPGPNTDLPYTSEQQTNQQQ